MNNYIEIEIDNNDTEYTIKMRYNDYIKVFSGKVNVNTTFDKTALLGTIDALQRLKRFDIPIIVHVKSDYMLEVINNSKDIDEYIEIWKEFFYLLNQIPTICFTKLKWIKDV